MLPLSPSPFWFMAGEKPCTTCRGTGLDWHANAGSPSDCPACRGTGTRVRRAATSGGARLARYVGTVVAVVGALALA